MSYNLQVIKFLKGVKATLEEPARNNLDKGKERTKEAACKELDRTVRVLERAKTVIPENETGQIAIADLVYRFFVRYHTLVKDNPEQHEKLVLDLSSDVGITPKKTESPSPK